MVLVRCWFGRFIVAFGGFIVSGCWLFSALLYFDLVLLWCLLVLCSWIFQV